MVSIAAFQAVDPGSIPGRRNFFQKSFPSDFNIGVGGTNLSPTSPNVMSILLFDQKNFLHAVTRIRTWVTAATTQGPNH